MRYESEAYNFYFINNYIVTPSWQKQRLLTKDEALAMHHLASLTL